MLSTPRRLVSLLSVLSLAAGLLTLVPVVAEASACDGIATAPSATPRIGLHSDAECRKFFVDARPSVDQLAGHASETDANRGSGALPADAFKLHTRPTSSNILYLDFDGHTWSAGTWWDGYYAGTVGALDGRVSPGYDRDGDPTTFTEGERSEIIQVWESVAEDFAVFDVDVTTEKPTGARADLFATRGSWALMLTDQGLQNGCGCGGIAYLDVFANGDPYLRPALNFMDFGGWRTSAWDLAEIAAHEVGHNFGLFHDGTSAIEYYGGQSMWTPIMGAGRGAGIATWSAGGYPDSKTRGAQAFEDDFATIARYAPLLGDVVGDSSGTAQDLGQVRNTKEVTGLINSAADLDWYKFTVPSGGAGEWHIDLDSQGYAPNLDPQLRLFSSSSNLLVTSNPLVPTGPVWGVITQGMDAAIKRTLTAGTYYVAIEGVGQGSLSDGTGYSDYASVGTYTLSISSPTPTTPAISSLSKSSGGPGTAVYISGSNLDLVTSVSFGSVPAPRFTTIGSDRIVVGVPTGAGLAYVKVFDSGGTAYQSPTQFDGGGAAVAPTITSLGNRVAGLAEWVTVNGANVGAATSVTLAGSQVEFLPAGVDSLAFKATSGQRGGAVAVTTAGGVASDATGLRLQAGPLIDSLSASSAYAGQTIEVKGGNLLEVSQVLLAGEPVGFSVASDNSLTFTIPTRASSGDVNVANSWGADKIGLTVLRRLPSVSQITPAQASPGASVAITGSWLSTTESVSFNGSPAVFQVVSDSLVTATVPAGATTGTITVVTEYGSWTSTDNFTVFVPKSKPVITKFTPARAKAGAVVVIYGKNFNGALTVWFGGVKALKVKRLSATKLQVTVPPSAKSGYVQVKAAGGTVRSSGKFTRLR